MTFQGVSIGYSLELHISTILRILSVYQNLVPGVLPPLPRLEDDYTLGDIVLGTPQIAKDCEADGKHLDDYLPVSHSQ